MTEVMRALLASPLAGSYRLDIVPTHRGPGSIRRLAVYSLALLRLTWWSIRGRGRIVHIHATVRGSMYRKAGLVLLARVLRRQVVLHVHSGPGDVVTFRAGLDRASVVFFRFSFRLAEVVLAVSTASAAALELAFGADRVVVVPNAAPRGPGEPLHRDRHGTPLAVYLGGFANPVKGGEVLLEALALPEAAELRVMLAGPGELPEAGRQLVAGRQALEWRGWLDASQKDDVLRAAEIFILASTSEGLPIALLEAMSYGLAIVATKVGGVPDVVKSETEALLVPPGDAATLAAALARVANDPDMRARMGDAARESAGRLSPEEVANRLDALYRRLLYRSQH
jgi:glycosyltransferase involved in cell wall biosynthesis